MKMPINHRDDILSFKKVVARAHSSGRKKLEENATQENNNSN